MQDVAKLLKLLLKNHEVGNQEEIIQNCIECYLDPDKYLEQNDAEWILEVEENGGFEFSITNEIYDSFISGDKIDEIHEKINELDDTFPQEYRLNVPGYFKWANQKLEQKKPPLAIIELGSTYADGLQLIIVYKADVNEIGRLCMELNVRFKKL
jgi:hypothetical protein